MPSLKSSIGKRDFVSLDDVCILLSINVIQDEIGQFIKVEKPYLVFCSKMSITRAEFNAAGQVGHKPELMLIVDSDSYDQEKYFEYEKKKYSIYKSFMRVDGFTELYGEVVAGD